MGIVGRRRPGGSVPILHLPVLPKLYSIGMEFTTSVIHSVFLLKSVTSEGFHDCTYDESLGPTCQAKAVKGTWMFERILLNVFIICRFIYHNSHFTHITCKLITPFPFT